MSRQNEDDRWGPMPVRPSIIRKAEVSRRTGLSRVQLWRLEKRGEFPALVRLTEDGSAAGYFEHQITAWIISRVRSGGRRLPPGCQGVEPEPANRENRQCLLRQSEAARRATTRANSGAE
jgi:predicted DNA-binding transcriptional regulator AlpA